MKQKKCPYDGAELARLIEYAVTTFGALADKEHIFHLESAVRALTKTVTSTVPTTRVNQSTVNRFSTLLSTANDDDSFADITFRVGDEQTRAHKCILANASSVFKAMLADRSGSNAPTSTTGGARKAKRRRKSSSSSSSSSTPVSSVGMLEATTSVIDLSNGNVTMEGLSLFLRYIYCGEITDKYLVERKMEVLELSERYGMDDLKAMAENILCKEADVTDVVPLLQTAFLFNAEKLKSVCWTLIRRNSAKLMVTPEFMALAQQDPVIWQELVEELSK